LIFKKKNLIFSSNKFSISAMRTKPMILIALLLAAAAQTVAAG